MVFAWIMTIKTALKNQLQQRFAHRVRFDEPMSGHTSFRVGGPSDAWVAVTDESELMSLMPLLRDNGVPFLVLGGGSNLLVKDGGFRGVVISMAGRLTEISQIGIEKISAMAGAKLNSLCRYAIDKGLAGMNFAIGIPGTVGGGIRMNAGTALGAMGSVLEIIRVILPDGKNLQLKGSALLFDYRRLSFPDAVPASINDCVIIEGQFSLFPGCRESLTAEADTLLKNRRAAQPTHLPSAGCFFKNPENGEPAGKLIDLAGLKGLRVGDAEISPMHGNYIVNRGIASAADILSLMEIVRETVFKKFNVILEPEVQIVGI
ncbi:MAG: UDP-N-acetylmuramate dehydrogenase [Desulfobacteraceae bacterium]|nr:MAG: UDP-N-acetylmuramate dehydrogenase [Desulfobacteraceae bacterium]